MSQHRSRANRRQFLRIGGTILATGLLIYLVSQQGWDEILGSLQRITFLRFLAIFFLIFLSRLAVFGRWAALLRSTEVNLSLFEILKLTFAGLFAANFLPTSVGGDIVRLANTLRIREERGMYATSIVVDRLVGAFGMAMVLPIGVGLVFQVGLDNLTGIQSWLLLTIVASVFHQSATFREVFDKGRQSVDSAWRALKLWIRKPKALLAALFFTWLHMILKFTSMWLLFRSLGESIVVWEIAGLWSFVYFITLFPVSINGLGLQEVSTGFVYTSIGGMAMASSLSVALLIRTAELAASLPGALVLPSLIGPDENDQGELQDIQVG